MPGSNKLFCESVIYVLDRVVKDQRGCWCYMGYRGMQNGELTYGRVRTSKGILTVQHVMWKAFKGPVPNDLWLLHTCDNKACCNPKHLYAGTPKQNVADAIRAGTHPASANRIEAPATKPYRRF